MTAPLDLTKETVCLGAGGARRQTAHPRSERQRGWLQGNGGGDVPNYPRPSSRGPEGRLSFA